MPTSISSQDIRKKLLEERALENGDAALVIRIVGKRIFPSEVVSVPIRHNGRVVCANCGYYLEENSVYCGMYNPRKKREGCGLPLLYPLLRTTLEVWKDPRTSSRKKQRLFFEAYEETKRNILQRGYDIRRGYKDTASATLKKILDGTSGVITGKRAVKLYRTN